MKPTTHITPDLFSGILPAEWKTIRDHNPRMVMAWHFADAADMAAICPPDAPPDAWDSDAWANGDSFRGASVAQSLDFARNGWMDGANQAAAMRDALTTVLPQALKIVRYDVAGSLPNVPRHLAGDPLSMRRVTQSETRKRPVITLVTSACVSGSVHTDRLTEHAIAHAAVVDILEDAGFRCEVIALIRTANNELGCEVAVRAKDAHEALNLPRLAFAVGHTALLRFFAFALMVTNQDARPIGGNYGYPVNKYQPNPSAGMFILRSPQETKASGARDAFLAITADLHKQGCPGIPAPEQLPNAA